jgi:hypothetical protein
MDDGGWGSSVTQDSGLFYSSSLNRQFVFEITETTTTTTTTTKPDRNNGNASRAAKEN